MVNKLNRFVSVLAFLCVLFAFAGSSSAAPSAVVTAEMISIQVDEEVCEAQPSLCTDTGSTGGAAANNTNVVMLIVQVIGPNSVPITGLASTDFALRQSYVANDVTFASCNSCFAEFGDGLYQLVVEPDFGFNWVAGTYHIQLQIDAGRTLYSLFKIEIPE